MKAIKGLWLAIAGAVAILLMCLLCFNVGREYERKTIFFEKPKEKLLLFDPLVIESTPDLIPILPEPPPKRKEVDL